MAQLYAKSCLDQNLRSLEEWKQDAFTQFGEMVGDEADTFPCVPGRQGFFLDHLRYGFVGDPRGEEAVNELAELLREYQSRLGKPVNMLRSFAFLKHRRI